GVLVALGYSANKQACASLGELLPWDLARALARGADGEANLRAVMLGAAGLLPGRRGLRVLEGEPRALETARRRLEPELARRPLGSATWRLGGVRPENSPSRRLVGG